MPLSKEELIETVKKLTAGEYASEEEGDAMLNAIRSSVRHPRVTNVLFYSSGKTAEQMVEELLSYQPIAMPPPTESNS